MGRAEVTIGAVVGVLCIGLMLWAAHALAGGPGMVLASSAIGLYSLGLK